LQSIAKVDTNVFICTSYIKSTFSYDLPTSDVRPLRTYPSQKCVRYDCTYIDCPPRTSRTMCSFYVRRHIGSRLHEVDTSGACHRGEIKGLRDDD
jgi:hypothetical protein